MSARAFVAELLQQISIAEGCRRLAMRNQDPDTMELALARLADLQEIAARNDLEELADLQPISA